MDIFLPSIYLYISDLDLPDTESGACTALWELQVVTLAGAAFAAAAARGLD